MKGVEDKPNAKRHGEADGYVPRSESDTWSDYLQSVALGTGIGMSANVIAAVAGMPAWWHAQNFGNLGHWVAAHAQGLGNLDVMGG